MDTHSVWQSVGMVREKTPLVHNITNYVVMNNTANALLCAGASPIMAHAPEEMGELVGIADALVLNIGTLSQAWLSSMLAAGKCADSKKIPVILDPVGAGATRFRTESSLRLLHVAKPAVVRGNGSEIMALNGAGGMARGVDSILTAADAEEAAISLARQFGCVVAVTGKQDLVTDGREIVHIAGGSALMARVTGMGCTSTAIVAAHVASHVAVQTASQGGQCRCSETASQAVLHGTVCGLGVMAVAGSMAEKLSQGPGSFQMHFLDALYGMSQTDIEYGLEITVANV